MKKVYNMMKTMDKVNEKPFLPKSQHTRTKGHSLLAGLKQTREVPFYSACSKFVELIATGDCKDI